MQCNFNLLAFPVSRRLQVRSQLVRHRQERVLGWKACFRQVQRHADWHVALTADAVDEAHEAHVMLGIVGQPVWTN